jgi:cytochrome b6-f complex iron-sulfur subunit
MTSDSTAKTVEVRTRREFCAQAGQVTCAAALALFLESCGGGSNSSPTAPSGASSLPTITGARGSSGTTVNIDAASPLSPGGGAALVQTASGTLLVAHISGDTFVAVTAICTHEGCTINGFSGQNYVCPCHGSTFDFNGRVLKGPATTSLRQFGTQFADGVLTIFA